MPISMDYNAVVKCEIKLFQNYFSLCQRPSETILPEIISEACCSSKIFSNMFSVTEIISQAEIIYSEIISDVITCEIKLCRNNFEIISVFYFTHNHHQWLHAK